MGQSSRPPAAPARLRGRESRRPLTGHTGWVRWGAWASLDNTLILATGGADRTVRLWDPATGQPHGAPLIGHAGPVRWGAWASLDDTPILATGDDDGTVRLWNPTTGKALGRPLTSHTGPVLWGAWGGRLDDPILATGSTDRTVRLWDPATGQPHGAPLIGHAGSVLWGAWGGRLDDPILATGDDDGTVRLWNPTTGKALGRPLTSHTGWVLWGAWASLDDTPILATGDDDGTVRLWNPATGQPHGAPLTGPVLWGAWASLDDTPILATGCEDGGVRLWEVVEDRPVPRMPSYQSDIAAGLADELGRDADAVAVAELICARSARPPLAVGLFGEWGEDKGHFLELVQQQVTATARPDNPLAHSAVRQVRFNAWHYAETELWRSLVAEMFTQLATPEDADRSDRAGHRRRRSRLGAETVAERALRHELSNARDRRDRLRKRLKRPEERWEELSAEQRQELQVLYGDRAEEIYEEAVRTAAAPQETLRHVFGLVRRFPWKAAAGFALLFVLLVVGTWGVTRGLSALWRWVATLPAGVAVAVVSAKALAVMRARASSAWKTVTRYVRQQAQRLQTAADVADADVKTLERRLRNLTAADELAGLISDHADAGGYHTQLGGMTQIREDFQHMATLLANAAASAAPTAPAEPTEPADEGADDRPPGIDRIILYVDDLDRCPPDRVVAMLEAIHLLLAVELFVVVVAVDPRWLLRAIASHYREVLDATAPAAFPGAAIVEADADDADLVDPHDEELWRSTPAQYLEKIFQVVLTLPPLDTAGYQRMLHTLVGPREDRPIRVPEPTADDAASVEQPPPSSAPAPVRPQEPAPDAEWSGVRLPAARVIERVDPLTLEPDELKLLNLLGPPLLVATPRSTKRLANSYGLLTALRRDHRDSDLRQHQATLKDDGTGEEREVGYYPYRAGMVLLAALIAYPALGPDLFRQLHESAAADHNRTWPGFLRQAHAQTGTSTGQARQWQGLLDGLRNITEAAPEHDLALPEPLTAWAAWLVPVGRLSFPTGRIVTTLTRRSPSPPTAR
ncbi:MAG TPA: P-loop NTPase fold protein [Streptosporangiaceae bacterium]|nr:P-loop NTPase fold protein [Streptosporangiaceae bacterium]